MSLLHRGDGGLCSQCLEMVVKHFQNLLVNMRDYILSLCCISFDHCYLICLLFGPSFMEVQYLIAGVLVISVMFNMFSVQWCPYCPTRDYKKATHSECNQAWCNFSRPICKSPCCILIIKTNTVGSMCESGFWFQKVNNSLTKLKHNFIQQQKV